MLHPITFSIPKEKIDEKENEKTKILSDLIPGDTSTYIYNTEEEYYNEYKKSYFAITKLKAGWDCMRHYEIIANGCIPYFIDIENCPKNTMYLLPKEKLIEANKLYDEKFKNKQMNELTEEDKRDYNILKRELLEYTKEHLTTEKMGEYVLKKTNYEKVEKILYLSGDIKPDYLRCLTLHGLKEKMGKECHDYPKIPHIYKTDSIDYTNLYGKGMSYTKLLEESMHDDNLDNSVYDDIKNKKYEIVIYGSYHRGMPYYDLVNEIYKPNEIILLCGEDIHWWCDCKHYVEKGHHVFVREL